MHADDVEITVSGTPAEPPSSTRALPLPDDEHPTVVVWRTDEGRDELQAATPAVAQLLGRPWLQDALELVLVKLERCRERCWRRDWVIELDIQKFFGTVRLLGIDETRPR